jgi:ankyrin repeat protein
MKGAYRQFVEACAQGDVACAKWLWERHSIELNPVPGPSMMPFPLFMAARIPRMVRWLLEAGANPNLSNDNGRTALIEAAAGGVAESVRLLLDAGANVDAVQRDGLAAIYTASVSGEKEVVRLLVEHGAHLDPAMSNGWTPLWGSIWWKREDVALLLIQAGANPRISLPQGVNDAQWVSADEFAASRGLPRVVDAIRAECARLELLGLDEPTYDVLTS